MTNKQESRLSMYQAVADFLLKNSETTNPLPNFASLFALLQQNIASLLLVVKDQTSNRSGIAENKKEQRADVELRTITLSGKLVAYATVENNKELLALIRLTKSELSTCADNVLVSHAVKVCDAAEAQLPNLAAYMVTAAEITGLRDTCTAYLLKMPQPMENRRDGKQTTLSLTVLMKDTDALLLKLDAIMLIIRFSNSGFYDRYKNSRSVINTASRSWALKGTVTDSLTSQGLAGVTLTIEPVNGTAGKSKGGSELSKNVKITAAKGGFTVKTLENGTYMVTASKEGYAPQTYTAYVTNGELCVVNIALQPL